MKLCIVPTIRPDLMFRFLDALHGCEQLRDWRVVAIAQRYSNTDLALLRDVGCFVITAEPQPVYPLRVAAMREFPADIYVNCDDDMIPLPGLTHWNVMASKLMCEQDIGVISGNWARSRAMLKHRSPMDEYVFQPITNMAGGQMYRRDVAEWLANNPYCPVEPYMFDDIQASLTAYVGGWRNARYRGSVLIHEILMPGGLKAQFATDATLRQPDLALLKTRQSKPVYHVDNNYLMPVAADIQPLAHQLHRTNREARFG